MAACPVNTYQNIGGRSECTSCPPGYSTEGLTARTSQSDCKGVLTRVGHGLIKAATAH